MSAQTTAPAALEDETAPIEDTDPGWRAMLDEWVRDQWRRLHHSRDDEKWPPEWLLPVVGGAGVLVVALLLFGLILPLLRWLARLITAAVDGGADWLHDWSFVQVVLDPMHRYFDTHSAGLPITADTLWWTWCSAGICFFLLAWIFRAVAARIGWVLFGAASVAMVWSATIGPARPTTAGIAALWWTVLSLPALRRGSTTPKAVTYVPESHAASSRKHHG